MNYQEKKLLFFPSFFFWQELLFFFSEIKSFNSQAVAISMFFGVLGVFYPLAKRFTYFPQTVLGLCFNSGLIISNFVITGGLDFFIIPFYLGAVFWTMIYDTVYAFQDIDDDVKIGVKSFAVKLGYDSKNVFYALNGVMGGCFLWGGYLAGLGSFYYTSVFFFVFKLKKDLEKLDLRNREECKQYFMGNYYFGMFMVFIIGGSKLVNEFIDYFWKDCDKKKEVRN